MKLFGNQPPGRRDLIKLNAVDLFLGDMAGVDEFRKALGEIEAPDVAGLVYDPVQGVEFKRLFQIIEQEQNEDLDVGLVPEFPFILLFHGLDLSFLVL